MNATHHKPRHAAIGFIFVALFLEVLGFGLLIPVGPDLIRHLLGDVSQNAAAPYVGWLSATYAIVQFLFAPMLGALSDRFGRRPVLLVAIFGSGLDYFAMAWAPTLWILFITRAVNGLSGATMSVCSAYVADVTPPEKRAAGFGILGAAFGLGFVIGPLLGGWLGDINIHLPFYVAGGLCMVNWVYGYFVLPESLDKAHRSHVSLAKLNPVASIVRAMTYPVVWRISGCWLFLGIANFALHSTWALSGAARYGWSHKQIGLSLAIVGVGAAVVQAGLAKKVIAGIGERRSIFLGLVIGILAFIGYGWAPEGWIIYIIIAVASFGGVAQPALQSFVTKHVRPDQQGLVQGALAGIQNLAQIGGYLAGAAVFAGLSDPVKSHPYIPGAAFYMSAVLCAVGTLIAMWATSPKHEPPIPRA